jgi:8-oxo-dGTP diphosphatase
VVAVSDPAAGAGRVEAAGGLPWRMADEVVEVLLVHRPKYDDWTFPKGKLEPGESFEDGARREVEEETGLRGVLGRELPPSEYVDNKGRPKLVRYWEMTVTDGTFTPNDEVDEVRWVAVDEADRLLTYPRDHEVLECFRVFAGVTPAS